MFDRFRTAYARSRDALDAEAVWAYPPLKGLEGYVAFAQEFAGASFNGGIYRVHDSVTGPHALSLVVDAFPEFAARVCPFGYDWLGRQFTVDSGRMAFGQPQVLLLEPGTGEALEIPVDFSRFHDEELIDHADAAIASDFFSVWSKFNADRLPLLRSQCVGYKVPLFLGGDDTAENLEVSDIDVYWTSCGQLRAQVT
jgi:hypothetical protein